MSTRIAAGSTAGNTRPSPILIQGSLVLGQCLFGIGSVIAALGLPACNPFAFALYREIAAGIILSVLSTTGMATAATTTAKSSSTTMTTPIKNKPSSTNKPPQAPPISYNLKRFVWLGLAIFGNQAGSIVGIKLAGPVTAAIWQPSQPIMTAAISMILQWEPPNKRRIAGVILSFIGCATMVLISAAVHKTTNGTTNGQEGISLEDMPEIQAEQQQQQQASSEGGRTTTQLLFGNALFFINCLSTSSYVILSKQPLRLYAPLTVTAWSYNIAALFMAIFTLASAPFLHLYCPDCLGVWTLPSTTTLWALLYYIVFNSVTAYAIMTWANQYATGTLIMGFTVLQPITATILTVVLLQFKIYPSCKHVFLPNAATDSSSNTPVTTCLDPPDTSAIIGMIGVLIGLSLIISTEPTHQSALDGKGLYKTLLTSDNNDKHDIIPSDNTGSKHGNDKEEKKTTSPRSKNGIVLPELRKKLEP